MKSYNGLYDKLITEDNLRLAMSNAARGKNKKRKRHRALKYIAQHQDEYVDTVRQWIEEYQPFEHRVKEINDGVNAKKRKIIVPTAREEVIHHAAVNLLKEIFMPPMYEHSYASIPGRGVHQAVKRISKWIYNDRANTKYCLKLDIRKYFDSIDQNVLLNKLRKLIRDAKFYDLLKKVIRTVDNGLPLGFVTSQWFANYLLTELDHKIKEEWGAKYYVRFMDDMVIFGSNKRKLHKIFDNIRAYLASELHLEVKDNWQVFYMDNGKDGKKGRTLDFLGFKFYRKHIGLRRKIVIRMHRKAKHIAKKKGANIHNTRQMVTYAGYTHYADCNEWFHKRVLPYVSIRRLRKKISNYDRTKARGELCVV